MATKSKQTQRSGVFKRCGGWGGCGGTGYVKGSLMRHARCKGTGMVRVS